MYTYETYFTVKKNHSGHSSELFPDSSLASSCFTSPTPRLRTTVRQVWKTQTILANWVRPLVTQSTFSLAKTACFQSDRSRADEREGGKDHHLSCISNYSALPRGQFSDEKLLLWVFKPFSVYHAPWLGSFLASHITSPSTL